jgi:hypothetical protein
MPKPTQMMGPAKTWRREAHISKALLTLLVHEVFGLVEAAVGSVCLRERLSLGHSNVMIVKLELGVQLGVRLLPTFGKDRIKPGRCSLQCGVIPKDGVNLA